MRKGFDGRNREWARALLALVLIVLLAVGLRPDAIPQWVAHQDKWLHLVGFLVFAWALCGAYPRLAARMLLAIGAGGAVAIEVAQAFLPMRTASLSDAAAGIAGVLLGRLAWTWVRRRSAPPCLAVHEADAIRR